MTSPRPFCLPFTVSPLVTVFILLRIHFKKSKCSYCIYYCADFDPETVWQYIAYFIITKR